MSDLELVRGKNDLHEELMLQAVSTVKLETKYLSEHIASGKKDDSRYELCSSDDNSNRMNEVLTAIYKGDRSDAGVKGTRIVIMPIAGRKMTGEI